jgi:hypothetical protein
MAVLMKYLRAFIFFLSTAILSLGLLLFGWGLDNLRGLFSLAPRAGYALSVVLFAAAVGAQAFSGKEGIRGGKGEETKWNRRETVMRLALSAAILASTLGRGCQIESE